MTARARARARRLRLGAAAALLAAAACHHENPSSPQPVLHAIDVSTDALATAEDGLPATFEVVLRSRPAAPVDVEVRSEDATEGLVLAPGYALPAQAREISFTPDDWDVPRRVTVHPVDDAVVDGEVEYELTLRVTYADDRDYASVPAVAITVSNADDDVAAIAVSAQTLATREGGPPATFQVRLTSAPTQWSQFGIVSDDPSAGLVSLAGPSGCSYASQWASLYFGPSDWHVPREVVVCPQDDGYAEPDRTYAIRVRTAGVAPEYEHVPEAIVTVTHASDDVAGLLVWADASPASPLVTAENGAGARLAVSLECSPRGVLVVPVTSGMPSEGLLAPDGGVPAPSVELTFTEWNWSSPQWLTVVGQDDLPAPVPGDDVAYAVAVGPTQGTDPVYLSLPARSVPALNLDDDVAYLRVDPAGPFTTSETGGTASFALSIAPPRSAVVVRVTSGDPGEGLVRGGGLDQESVDVWFAPDDWGPKTVHAVGQRDHALDGDASYVVSVAVLSGDERYLALAPLALEGTNVDEVAGSLPLATWDATLGVPACREGGYGCESGTLLNGRGNDYAEGAETNPPNTLATSYCADGTYTYIPRSLEELRVYVPDGSPLAAGEQVRIEAKVRVMNRDYDRLDLYLAADASAPAWTYLGTFPPTVTGGLEVIATSAVLPAGTLQAIRGNWRYAAWAGTPGTCTGSGADDRDDLVFAVAP